MKKPHMEEESKPPSCISTENDEPPGKEEENNTQNDLETHLHQFGGDRCHVQYVRSVLAWCSELLACSIVHWDQSHPRVHHKLPVLASYRYL